MRVLLISLTGIWVFILLTVAVLLISLTGIWPFSMPTVLVLLKSLTGVWSLIILILGGSTQVSDWYLDLYYSYCWGFC